MKEQILTIVNTFEVQVMIRLLLCTILAAFIGRERQVLNKPAGTRTHMLLCITGCLVMVCGEYLSITQGVADSTRIPAQLLSGIGFIGAGTILKEGGNIKGLTTAASLLFITCIGLSIGAGFYLGGIMGTLILYIVLTLPYKYGSNITSKFKDFEWSLKYKKDCDIESIQKVLAEENVLIREISIDDKEKVLVVRGKYEEVFKQAAITKLIKDAGVIEIIEG